MNTGEYNTAIGYFALQQNTTANNNTAVGYEALTANTGSNNNALGSEAIEKNTTGTTSIFNEEINTLKNQVDEISKMKSTVMKYSSEWNCMIVVT